MSARSNLYAVYQLNSPSLSALDDPCSMCARESVRQDHLEAPHSVSMIGRVSPSSSQT